jgi:hypothetical protein
MDVAAGPAGADPGEIQPAENQRKMPEPLAAIYGNLHDLEATGYFQILEARLGRTKPLDQDAMIWTVQVLRPITHRHAMLELRRLGDVRFYRNAEHGRFEVYWTELYYSSWIPAGAVHHEILDVDEQFEIWILLDQDQIDQLDRKFADTVEFRELKR